MKKIIYLLGFLLSFNTINAQTKLEVTDIFDNLFGVDSISAIDYLSTISNRKDIKIQNKDSFFIPNLFCKIRQKKIKEILINSTNTFTINDNPISEKFDFSVLEEKFQLSSIGSLINDFEKSKQSVVTLYGNYNKYPLEIVVICPDTTFHSSIISEPCTINNVRSILSRELRLKSIKLSLSSLTFNELPSVKMSVSSFPDIFYQYMREEKPNEALTVLNKIITQNPNNVDALRYKISILTHLQRIDEAILTSAKINKTAKSSSDLLNLQELLLIKGDYQTLKKSQKENERYIRSSNDRLLWYLYGYLADIAQNKDTQKDRNNIGEALKYLDFADFGWSFEPMKTWLDNNSQLTDIQKTSISKIIYDIEETSSDVVSTACEVDLSEKVDTNAIFQWPTNLPRFVGSKKEQNQYIQEHLIYPKEAKEQGISGTVYVKFIVDIDGTVRDKIEILKKVGFGCDEEAVSMVKSMPKWKPAFDFGKCRFVRSYLTIPIHFKNI